MKQIAQAIFRRFGYQVVRHGERTLPDLAPDLTSAELETLASVRDYTMTGLARTAALIQAITYICDNAIPGAIVECGVWRGGSMMAAAQTLKRLGDVERDLYLFDTFQGMPAPTAADRHFSGLPAADLLRSTAHGEGVWCYAGLDDVHANMLSTGYPAQKIHFVQGMVEDTIPGSAPTTIALLRLDTDWYESTKHELVHLYPRLSRRGILIVDDYGHWAGARTATDEFLRDNAPGLFLHRIDYTGRLAIKTD